VRILVKIDIVPGGHADLSDLLDLTRSVQKRVIKAEQDYLDYICRELRLKTSRILIMLRGSWELSLMPSGLITPLTWKWV
jgi:hypothetical protein